MITITHKLTFENPTEVADWLNGKRESGTLTAQVHGGVITLTYDDPPGGATCGGTSFASPTPAQRRFMRLIRECDGAAESYQSKL